MALSDNGLFQIGDAVCHKYMGAGEIQRIRNNGQDTFYEIKMVLGCTRVLVSLQSAKAVLRPISNREVIEEVLHLLGKPLEDHKIPRSGRQARERMLTEKMNANDLREVSDIYRYLESQKGKKILSEKDRRYLEMARRILLSEISLVLGKPVEEIQEMLTA